ncbi:hypothetical protein [Conservatibacter flavescens]|uniref:Uncharacterized protein n=1 Tax=Conservatibacter flavescens TaxID=28161 RepID=A0A2M8S2W8_9PAST|nr:hypothetical protein [Conservatibacter flavescens]PJG85476.1 hypothetical protein CVP05_05930 [Conservatibacter flavescens]
MKIKFINIMMKLCVLLFLGSIKFSYSSFDNNSDKPIFSGNEISDFNGDGLEDKLYYKCYRGDGKGGLPYCTINIVTKQKNYQFTTIFIWEPIIASCGKGCLSITDDITKNQEMYTTEYKYNKELDNWIRVSYELLTPDNKATDLLTQEEKKQIIGIDGKEY